MLTIGLKIGSYKEMFRVQLQDLDSIREVVYHTTIFINKVF